MLSFYIFAFSLVYLPHLSSQVKVKVQDILVPIANHYSMVGMASNESYKADRSSVGCCSDELCFKCLKPIWFDQGTRSNNMLVGTEGDKFPDPPFRGYKTDWVYGADAIKFSRAYKTMNEKEIILDVRQRRAHWTLKDGEQIALEQFLGWSTPPDASGKSFEMHYKDHKACKDLVSKWYKHKRYLKEANLVQDATQCLKDLNLCNLNTNPQNRQWYGEPLKKYPSQVEKIACGTPQVDDEGTGIAMERPGGWMDPGASPDAKLYKEAEDKALTVLENEFKLAKSMLTVKRSAVKFGDNAYPPLHIFWSSDPDHFEQLLTFSANDAWSDGWSVDVKGLRKVSSTKETDEQIVSRLEAAGLKPSRIIA